MENDMKKLILILFVVLAYRLFGLVTFEKTFGLSGEDRGQSIQQTSDGGYIIAGSTSSFGAGSLDVYLLKTDSDGAGEWGNSFGGTSYDVGNSVFQTTDGGYIITGSTRSFGAGWDDVYLIKANNLGEFQWQKTFGGEFNDVGFSIQQTTDGCYIITGTTYCYHSEWGTFSDDILLIKIDLLGNLIWYKTFDIASDKGFSVMQSSDGGYIITGSTYYQSSDRSYVLLIKTDENGNQSWYKTFSVEESNVGYSVQLTSDGGYIITGSTYYYDAAWGEDYYDVLLLKTDDSGNQSWYKTFGNGWYSDEGYSVQQTTEGGYIIVGYSSSYGAGETDVWLIKTDSNGNLIWEQTIGGANYDYGKSVRQTSDGGYVITGDTNSYSSSSDIYIIKTDEYGSVGIQNENNIDEACLYQNYPNPFNLTTSINYSIPNNGEVNLKVFDITGREVVTLVNRVEIQGLHNVSFNADNLTSGIYFYRLAIDGKNVANKKLILLK